MALDFPSSPTNGQVYTSGTTSWTWYNDVGAWRITSSGPTGYTGSKGDTGYTGSRAQTYIGAVAPSSPVNGDTWWNSNDGVRYVYYVDVDSSQWVQESAPPPAPQPVDILNNFLLMGA